MPISDREFEQAKISEHSLVLEGIKKYYSLQKLAVFTEKKMGRFRPDLVAIKNQNHVIAVEVKPNDVNEIRKGVGQCFSYIDWVHEVYLAIPVKGLPLTNQLLNGTPIGILTVADEKGTMVKKAKMQEPDNSKLLQLLGCTIGFCWICGRTFNTVRQAKKEMGGTYIAHRDAEPELYKALERIYGKTIRTKGSWVQICAVCSRILGDATHDYIMQLFSQEISAFEFEELLIQEDKKIMKNWVAQEVKRQLSRKPKRKSLIDN